VVVLHAGQPYQSRAASIPDGAINTSRTQPMNISLYYFLADDAHAYAHDMHATTCMHKKRVSRRASFYRQEA
jgi:hypothetical protein